MTKPSVKLYPCPFCGSKDIRVLPQEYGSIVDCVSCGATKRVYSELKDQNYTEWNKRLASNNLTQNHLTLLLKVLEDLGEYYSNAGCNDMVLANTDENWEFIHEAERWNSTNPEEWSERPPLSRAIETQDVIVLGYLKTLIKRSVQG